MDLRRNLLWQKIKTRFQGILIGEDEFGNKYYETRMLFRQSRGLQKRWVIYPSGGVEASNIPASWFGWLHYTSEAPLEINAPTKWVRRHKHNVTGTTRRYAATNSLLKENPDHLQKKTYQAWQP